MHESNLTPSMLKTIQFLIPAFNESAHIEQTLLSILRVKTERVKVIVSDNASTDSTHRILCQYAQNDPRLMILRQENNIGPAQNMQQLLTISDADYINYLGAHDLISDNYIQECLDIIDANCPEYAIPRPYMLLEGCDHANTTLDMRSDSRHKGYFSKDPLKRYISGVRFWPVNWYYSLIKRSVMIECFNAIKNFHTINSDHLIISHLLFISEPKYIDNAHLIFRSMKPQERENYTYRLGYDENEYSGMYQDRLWWAISYFYHFERILGAYYNQNRVEMKPWLHTCATAIARLSEGPSRHGYFSRILSELADWSSNPIRYMS